MGHLRAEARQWPKTEDAAYEKCKQMDLRRSRVSGTSVLGSGVRVERTVRADRRRVPPLEHRTAFPDLYDRDELFLPWRPDLRRAFRAHFPANFPLDIRPAVSGGLPADGEYAVAAHAVCRLRRGLRAGLRLLV